MNNKSIYKIFLTGGGTGGSVAPLLAIYDEFKDQDVVRPASSQFEFLWLGTKFGPERVMVEKEGIKFKAISSGKWRRYFSLKNLVDIFKIKFGFWQAFFIILKSRPSLVMSAGSFASVPVIWAAWLLRVPVLIHQQDIRPGLANKLMAPFAKIVTVAFEKSLADYGKKAVWIGNPVRRKLRISNFKTNESLPVVLIVGGGTGATAINELVKSSSNELTKFCRIIHVVGKNKSNLSNGLRVAGYEVFEFLNTEQMAETLNKADLVITRAGMGFLSELSYLGKPTIIIPMPDSHQEDNAAFFRNKKAAVTVKQKYLTADNFTHMIKDLLSDEKSLEKLSANMAQAMKKGANQEAMKIIKNLLN